MYCNFPIPNFENTSQAALKSCTVTEALCTNNMQRVLVLHKTSGCQWVQTLEHKLDPILTFSDKHKKPITVENLMSVSRMRASGLILLQHFTRLFKKQFIQFIAVASCVSVKAEGGVALVTLASEVSYQLTVTYHQKQAATCGAEKM